MNASTATATDEQPRGMSELGRITGVFWSPGAAFKDIAARPAPWAPLVLIMLAGVALTFAIGKLVGWGAIIEQELANNSRMQQLPPEQMQKIIEQQTSVAGVLAYLGPTLFAVIMLLATAGVLLLVMKIGGGSDVSFKQSFGVTCYAWLPMALPGLLSLLVLIVNPPDFNVKNPLPFNAGWFLDPANSPAWMIGLLSSIDLFSFWVMALLALGFAAAAKKIKFGTAFALVLACWLVVVVVKTGWAAAFG